MALWNIIWNQIMFEGNLITEVILSTNDKPTGRVKIRYNVSHTILKLFKTNESGRQI